MRHSIRATIALLAAVTVSADKLPYTPPSGGPGISGNINSVGISSFSGNQNSVGVSSFSGNVNSIGGSGFSGNFNSVASFGGGCSLGEARNVKGQCVKAQISRKLFLFSAPPPQKIPVGPAPLLPAPKIHYNFVFVRSPQTVGGAKPIVVPPPQQKTLVYVLSKRPSALDQEVIEVGSTAVKPEVFFVNYGPGENVDLPGGVSLQEALSQSAQQGQYIDGGADRSDEGNHLGSGGQESFLAPGGGSDLNFGINNNVNLGGSGNLVDLNAFSSSGASSGLSSSFESNSFTHDSLTNEFVTTVDIGVQGLGEVIQSPPPIQIYPPSSIYSTP